MQLNMEGHAVSQKDLFEAVEVVLVGKEKKDRIMSQEERQYRILPRGRTCTGKRSPEGFRAGTEDYYRTENHGRSRICNADTGGREVS